MPTEAHEKVEERLKEESNPGCMTEMFKKQVLIMQGPGVGGMGCRVRLFKYVITLFKLSKVERDWSALG